MKILYFIVPFLLFVSCQSDHQATIYFGGSILTMDGDKPSYIESVVEVNGKTVFTGSLTNAFQKYSKAKKVDLKGKTMLPSFLDPHGHFAAAIQMAEQVNVAIPPVGGVKNISDIQKILKKFQEVNDIPKGEWVVGWGYDNEGLEESRHITKFDLDKALPDHKVMLIHVSGHGIVLNSKALKWAEIDKNTQTPSGGVIARVNGTTEPAGLLMETAYFYLVLEKLPPMSEEKRLKNLDKAQQMYASEGYTHIQDGATLFHDIKFFQKAAKQKRFYLDVVSLPAFNDYEKWFKKGLFKFGNYDNHLKFQGVKILQDGSPQGKTAFITNEYLTGGPGGQLHWHGEGTLEHDEFIKLFKMFADNGLQVFTHANGDAAIDEVIEATKTSGVKASDDRRFVVIHSQFQRPDHLDKYVDLGLYPSYFTNHTFFWGDVHIKNIGMEKAKFISPVKTATDKGLIYSNHTDFNVTPLDPFFVLWTAVSRKTRNGVVLGEDQRVDMYTALQGLTTGPAYQVFEENRKGKIKVGHLADYVILDKNPMDLKGDEIKEIQVMQTIKEGKTVFLKN
ncbi:amidohydrolase [Halobacteriovorax sp. GFR7]|uniref:amidohydrolase n=1 Tax=unclassified Halobacteriovorax TaxID=2639665 RepID=UPI003D958AE2